MMNFKELMLLSLLWCIHTLVPAALSDDDLSFWDDGWRTGQESATISEPLPDLTLYNPSLEEISRRFPEQTIQHSPPDTLPAATTATAPPARDVSYDRLRANRTQIKRSIGQRAVVNDFFMCPKCRYTTGDKADLEYHKKNNHRRLYRCIVPGCTYTANSLQSLVEHTEKYHPNN
jgi:hypothetical protein